MPDAAGGRDHQSMGRDLFADDNDCRQILSHALLEEIQQEWFADDIPIQYEQMQFWTAPDARAFFESGGTALPTTTTPATMTPTLIPCCYIHIGYAQYVETAIRVTASHHQPVIILGDDSMRRLHQCSEGVEFVDVAPFRSDPAIAAARQYYKHYSSNASGFEFFCFERIFILRRFLESRGLDRVFHLDSDCVLLRPLSDFTPLRRHAVWLVNNDHYHLHGFSPLPTSSVHASVLTPRFCRLFEKLYHEMYVRAACELPPSVRELLRWAERHARGGGAGGLSDMTLYFLLQRRRDAWRDQALGWLDDGVGDLGSIWQADEDGAEDEGGGGAGGEHLQGSSRPTDAAAWMTFMNNISTGEGPDGLDQYAFDPSTRTMRVGRSANGRLAIRDKLYAGGAGRDVEIFCAHFSGSAKCFLQPDWLARHFGIAPGVFERRKVGVRLKP